MIASVDVSKTLIFVISSDRLPLWVSASYTTTTMFWGWFRENKRAIFFSHGQHHPGEVLRRLYLYKYLLVSKRHHIYVRGPSNMFSSIFASLTPTSVQKPMTLLPVFVMRLFGTTSVIYWIDLSQVATNIVCSATINWEWRNIRNFQRLVLYKTNLCPFVESSSGIQRCYCFQWMWHAISVDSCEYFLANDFLWLYALVELFQ